MHKFNFYLFSSNCKLAQKLYYLGKLNAVYLEQRHFTQEMFNFTKLRNIPLYIVNNIAELDEALKNNIKDNSIGISFGIGLFFKNRHINSFEHGIWNIHTGKLPENRGRHPISWTFINNDDYFYLTIHQINEELDKGKLIYEQRFERDINDTQAEILKKMEDALSSDFIKIAVDKYLNSEVFELEDGIYNKNLQGKFTNINPKEYDSAELFSIFKSQIYYGPVCINNSEYISCDFYSELLDYNDCQIFACKDGIKLAMGRFK